MNGLPREYLTRLGLGHFGESRTSKIPGKLGSVPLESRITKEGPKWQFDDMALRCNWLGACYLDAANRMRAIGAHVCRTVCRRAERAVVYLAGQQEINEQVVIYLNRLSDLFFAWARWVNHVTGDGDVIWEGR